MTRRITDMSHYDPRVSLTHLTEVILMPHELPWRAFSRRIDCNAPARFSMTCQPLKMMTGVNRYGDECLRDLTAPFSHQA